MSRKKPAPPKLCEARRKLRELLKRFSQRELARELHVPQPSICLINSGAREPRQATKRKFEAVGVAISDWDS